MDKATAPAPARKRRTQLERRTEAERRLLDSALTLVVEKGVVRMTLGEVGERAGYSRGQPAHRYGTKEGLLKALLLQITEDFQADRLQARLQPGLETLLGTIRIYLDRSGQRDRGLLAMHVLFSDVFIAGSEIAATLEDFNRATLAFYQKQIRVGMRKGEIRSDLDPVAQSIAILGWVRGISTQFFLGPPTRNWATARDVLLHTLERELRA